LHIRRQFSVDSHTRGWKKAHDLFNQALERKVLGKNMGKMHGLPVNCHVTVDMSAEKPFCLDA
jgi:hypothetical protein